MAAAIPDGSFVLFRRREGEPSASSLVLVSLRGVQDPESEAAYTVKRWHRVSPDEVRLLPENAAFPAIRLTETALHESRVVAEVVAVLGPRRPRSA